MAGSHSERAAPAGPGDGSENRVFDGIETTARMIETQALPVCIGERFIGFLVSVPAGFEAGTVGGAQLGRFNTEQAAANALAARVGDCRDG